MIKVTVGNITRSSDVLVDPGKTLRQVFEDNHVDYSAGSPTLDGTPLEPGEIDKTFAEFGVRDHCFLLVSMKLNCAAKVLILGYAVVIRSDIKLDDIRRVKQFLPDRLNQYEYDDNKQTNVLNFGMDIADEGPGHLGRYGISFSPTPDVNGLAVATIQAPEGVTDVKAWFVRNHASELVKIFKAEDYAKGALIDIANYDAAVDRAIEVL